MKRKLLRTILIWGLSSPLVALILFPLSVMFVTAIKPPGEVFSSNWWPQNPAWYNFIGMWRVADFAQALINSIYVALLSTVISLAVALPAAYVICRSSSSGRGLYQQFLVVTQMLSPIVLVIGLFKLVVWFGAVDSIHAMAYIYAAFNVAFAVWMLQSYFTTIPEDVEYVSWLEGASYLQTIRYVVFPIAVPAIAVTCIFSFINAWNEFVVALTILRSEENFTLNIRIFSMMAGRYTVEWHYVMAATFTATFPVAIVFAFLQRYFVRGLTLGAIK